MSGVSNRATTRENSTATQTVRPNSRKNCPAMPFMKLTGMNTTTMAIVVATTARPMASAPCSAAWNGRMPWATRFSMFSISTMASSTRMPTTRVRASSVTTFSENPNRFMKKKVGISDTGMAKAVIIVERQSRRKTNTTMAASSMPSSSTCWVARKLARVSSTEEKMRVKVTPLWSFSSLAIALMTASSTPTSLESRVFMTWKPTTGAPFRRAKPRTSLAPSPTSATSVSFT